MEEYDPSAGTITVLASDSSKFRPRKVDEPVAVLGYVIQPGAVSPKRVEIDFTTNQLSRPTLGYPPYVPPEFSTLSATSTASVSSVASMDDNFLRDAEFLSVPMETIEASRAGRGTQVYDALAYLSGLRRAERMGVTGRLVQQTDGELPDWIEGKKKVTLDVMGNDIAPRLLAAIRQMEERFDGVTRQALRGVLNPAHSGPIRDLIAKAKALR